MMLQNLFDSHAHYDDPRFDGDREALLASLPTHGIRAVMNVGNTTQANLAGIALAEEYPFFYCSVGIHPDQAAEIARQAAQDNNAYLELLERQTRLPKVQAIGEIGLDYYYDDASPRQVQRLVFEQQLALARDLDLPVIIHDRDAHQDTLELVRRYRPRGIFHCFSGSAEMAREVVGLGMYLGFTGVVTFKNARRALEAAQQVPLDRLLIETDCPYMAPEPHRGKRCDSTLLCHTLERLAQLKGVDPQRLADQTLENGCQVYGIRLGQ